LTALKRSWILQENLVLEPASLTQPVESSALPDDGVAERHAETDRTQPTTAFDVAPDVSRQAGDSSLYKLYLKSVGWTVAATFLASIIVSVAISKMPR
jgi:hypothetical protein